MMVQQPVLSSPTRRLQTIKYTKYNIHQKRTFTQKAQTMGATINCEKKHTNLEWSAAKAIGVLNLFHLPNLRC